MVVFCLKKQAKVLHNYIFISIFDTVKKNNEYNFKYYLVVAL